MTVVRISSKGQITLPVEARRKLGIEPNSRVELVLREGEIAIRPAQTVGDLYGVFHSYAEGREPVSWDEQRRIAVRAAAQEAHEG